MVVGVGGCVSVEETKPRLSPHGLRARDHRTLMQPVCLTQMQPDSQSKMAKTKALDQKFVSKTGFARSWVDICWLPSQVPQVEQELNVLG